MAHKRPDVMKTLADARPPEFDPERLAGSERARHDLNTILAGAPEERTASRSARPFTWRWALPVAATAAAAGVLVATLPEGGSGTRDTRGSRATAGPTAGPATDGPRHTPESGRLALLNVAARVDRTADEGTYWQTTTRSSRIDVATAAESTFAVASSETSRWSFGVRPGTRSLWISGIDATTEPRTERDTARWRAAGSPKDLTLAESGSGGKLGLRLEPGARKRPTVERINGGDKIAALGARNVSYAELRKLPGDSPKLKEVLADLYEEDRGSEISGRTEWMWRQAAGLIGLPVRPEVRAAAYRVIADLPGIRSLGEMTDPLGRKGAGFALPATARPDYGTARSELIVDPATGALLSDQEVLTKPNAKAAEAGLTAGTVVNSTATVTSKWTDRQLKTP
ncbi:CU044_5270 family protein [Streptomyces rugosispiralis]|uniref:CU044_5270 family protein n=1 Tax=Streptomyces rugosispiralis TaxID=2967341 RepID=A0ABT1UXS8_9ACTN|nr:CU044_5270 family protein [Streptomyces rugosispiralis]MCQ8189613.1 CU044_5270 family protein [Streptomyces rugosispiralis]